MKKDVYELKYNGLLPCEIVDWDKDCLPEFPVDFFGAEKVKSTVREFKQNNIYDRDYVALPQYDFSGTKLDIVKQVLELALLSAIDRNIVCLDNYEVEPRLSDRLFAILRNAYNKSMYLHTQYLKSSLYNFYTHRDKVLEYAKTNELETKQVDGVIKCCLPYGGTLYGMQMIDDVVTESEVFEDMPKPPHKKHVIIATHKRTNDNRVVTVNDKVTKIGMAILNNKSVLLGMY